MSRPIIRQHNIETDEIIDREMNDEEYSQYLSNIESINTENLEKAAAKQALLEKLGITEEEAKLLLS